MILGDLECPSSLLLSLFLLLRFSSSFILFLHLSIPFRFLYFAVFFFSVFFYICCCPSLHPTVPFQASNEGLISSLFFVVVGFLFVK
jgi:hypothetical protein